MTRKIQMPPGQWNEDFVNKMQARMFVGFFRYGDTKRYAESKQYDLLRTIEKYLNEYKKDGNLEHLVNIANYCMIEFMYPQHALAHFESIEEEDPTKRIGVVKNSVDEIETLIKVDNLFEGEDNEL